MMTVDEANRATVDELRRRHEENGEIFVAGDGQVTLVASADEKEEEALSL